jgi:hypothetical protein
MWSAKAGNIKTFSTSMRAYVSEAQMLRVANIKYGAEGVDEDEAWILLGSSRTIASHVNKSAS